MTTATMTNSSAAPTPEGCVLTQAFTFVPWDNEDNLVPKEVDNVLNLLLLGVGQPLLFIVSFCTNILSMAVFWKHGLRERINACLFTLSLVDMLSVSVAFGYSSDLLYMFVIGKGGQLGPASQFFIRHFLMGLWGFVTSSQLVYCVIVLERCLCVTRPLLVKSFMSTTVTVVALWVMIVVVTGAFVLIAGVRYSVKCVVDPADGTVSYTNYPTDFYFRHQFVMDFMYSVVYGLFFPGFSLVCVTACTAVTAVKLKKLSAWREKVSSASHAVTARDLALTRVIIGTSILFLVCIVPAILMRASFLLVPDLKEGGRYDNLAWVFKRFYSFFSAVNNTFNFFVYYASGSKFRETTRRLLSGCRRHDRGTQDQISCYRRHDRGKQDQM